MKNKGNGISSQVRCTYVEYLRPGTNLNHICSVHGRGGRRMPTLTRVNGSGPIRPTFVVQNTQPVFPIAPTVIGTDDPYDSIAPVLRARVAPLVVEEESEEGEEEEAVDNNGIPVARPVIVESEEEDLPAQRVRLPAPRAIEFD